MASSHEILGLATFASRVPAIFVRKGVKRFLLESLDPDRKLRDQEDEFLLALEAMERKPDAVALLEASASAKLALPKAKHVLYVEVEFSSPIPLDSLLEYAELYDLALGSESPYHIAVALVDRYGSHKFLDLGGILIAMRCVTDEKLKNAAAINAYGPRSFARV